MPDNKDLITEIFGEDKADQVLTLLADERKQAVAAADSRMAETLADAGFRIRRPRVGERAVDRKLRLLKEIFDRGGVSPVDGQRWGFRDVQNIDVEFTELVKSGKIKPEEYEDVQYSQEQPLLFPRVVSQIVREAVEPELNITPLLQKVRYTNGPVITFPAVSSMAPGNLTIVEGGEYPEGKVEFAGQVTAAIGKYGLKVSMTDEMKRYSMWDVWAMNLRAAGRALGRWKEKMCVDHVLSQGTAFFDNGTAGANHTTGRDISGGFNGTFTCWDLYDMAADMIQEGFVPDLVLMHPFAWPIFALDPIMRTLGFLHNGPIMPGYQGSPANVGAFDVGGLNQQRQFSEPANRAQTFAPPPATYPFGPLRIVVSPFLPYDRTDNSTTIYLADSRDVGILVVDEEVVTDEWRHPEHDITNVKFRERYAVASANAGRSIRRAKDVVVARGYTWEHGVLQSAVTLGTSEFIV